MKTRIQRVLKKYQRASLVDIAAERFEIMFLQQSNGPPLFDKHDNLLQEIMSFQYNIEEEKRVRDRDEVDCKW